MSIRDSAAYAVAQILGIEREQLSSQPGAVAAMRLLLQALKLSLRRLLGAD